MKILITGCHGQLGTELQKQLADEECALGPLPERLRKATVIAVDVDELDITDREATVTYIRRTQPDTVINCAAFTNVDGCETNRDAAYRVNALGPRNLALACEKINARLIHISTDYVFPGTANGGVALDESALPAPFRPTARPSCWAKPMCSSSAAATLLCARLGCTAITAKTLSKLWSTWPKHMTP